MQNSFFKKLMAPHYFTATVDYPEMPSTKAVRSSSLRQVMRFAARFNNEAPGAEINVFRQSTGTIRSSSLGAWSSSASGVTRNESNESRNRPHYCQRSHRGDHWRHPYVNDADRQRQLVGGVSGEARWCLSSQHHRAFTQTNEKSNDER